MPYLGATITVEYLYTPDQNGGKTDPSWEAYVTVEKVYLDKGCTIDITDVAEALLGGSFEALEAALTAWLVREAEEC
jgi:hypothetical protein